MKPIIDADDEVYLKSENEALRKSLAALESIYPREGEDLIQMFDRLVFVFGDGGKYPRSQKIGPGQTFTITRKGHVAIWRRQALADARKLLGVTVPEESSEQ